MLFVLLLQRAEYSIMAQHVQCFSGDGVNAVRIAFITNIHYENLSMQYTVIFKVVKNENFQ